MNEFPTKRMRSLAGVELGPDHDGKYNADDYRNRFQRREKRKDPLRPNPRVGGEIGALYGSAVQAVQSRFSHLSPSDIANPPHGLYDAYLCRQIALHVLMTRCGVSKRRIVAELERSREAVNRALVIIDERLMKEEFAETYEAIADSTLEDVKSRRTET